MPAPGLKVSLEEHPGEEVACPGTRGLVSDDFQPAAEVRRLHLHPRQLVDSGVDEAGALDVETQQIPASSIKNRYLDGRRACDLESQTQHEHEMLHSA